MMQGPSKRLAGIAWRAGALGALVGAGYIARNWHRYGHPDPTLIADPLLDRFVPEYEVREQHEVHVHAPAGLTYRAALALNIYDSAIVRAIFRGREVLMRAEHRNAPPIETPFLEQMVRLGWGVLAEEHGREIALGAITKPWEPNPRFEPVLAAEFATFSHPLSVKIAWNVVVEPVAPRESICRTETRVVATDDEARRRFRLYWALVLPGVRLIRREVLRLVKTSAEATSRRGRTADTLQRAHP
jgi:hypothetical protein